MDAPIDNWQLTTIGGIGNIPLVFMCVLAVGGVLWTWFSLDPKYSVWQRATITALRGLIFGLAITLLLQPNLSIRKVKIQPSQLAVLIDTSVSMHAPADRSRLETALDIVAKQLMNVSPEGNPHSIALYGFNDELVPLNQLSDLTIGSHPSRGTDIPLALRQLNTLNQSEHLNGILLLSDGASTSSDSGIKAATALGLPINSVLLNQSDNLKDIRISKANVDPFAFSRNNTPITVEVVNAGLNQSNVDVSLFENGALMQTQNVEFIGGRGQAVFTIVPSTIGRHIVTASVPVHKEDAIPENNTTHVGFDVVRDKFRILHISGHPSWDQRFLRDTFTQWPQVDLVSFYVLRTPYQSTTQNNSGLSLIPFPTEELFKHHLNEFDVLIFQNFDPATVGVDTYLEEIVGFVKSGGGLVIMGAEQGLSSDVISQSPLASLLPMKLLPKNTALSRLTDSQSFRGKLTPAGERHPLMRLKSISQENINLWRSVPRIGGVVKTASRNPGATVLMEHPYTTIDDGPAPVMAVSEPNNGRILMITSDSLWQWRFTGPMVGSAGDTYTTFWKRAITWLTQDPELDKLRLHISPVSFTLENQLNLKVELLTEAYLPKSGSTLNVEISWFDSQGRTHTRTIKGRTDTNGQYLLKWQPVQHGPHAVRVTDVKTQRTAHDRFLVEPGKLEMNHLSPNGAYLKALSNATAGTFSTNQFDLKKIALKNLPTQEILSRHDIPIWSNPIAFILIFALLMAEWSLRRRLSIS